MQGITPFLWFDGKAEQATKFYVSVFKDGSEITDVARYPQGSPGGMAGKVMTVAFRLAGHEFVALNGGPMFQFTPAISFVCSCENQREVDYFWKKLSAGGEEQPCGWVKDRFGVSWQVVPTILAKLVGDEDPQRAARATQAMLGMKKLDIAALQKAHAGHDQAAERPAKRRPAAKRPVKKGAKR